MSSRWLPASMPISSVGSFTRRTGRWIRAQQLRYMRGATVYTRIQGSRPCRAHPKKKPRTGRGFK
jgi:hypothetical protein